MPELPEVQTTVNGLKRHIVGKTIVSAWSDPKMPTKSMDKMSWDKRRRLFEGKKIVEISRRAKYIVIRLGGGDHIYIHQKMTGHLLIGKWKIKSGKWVNLEEGPLGDKRNQHIRSLFALSGGIQVALSDARRFATITYVRDPQEHKHINKLGPEPLDISLKDFHKLFDRKRGVLKPTLMNPEFIVGIGNIYADEILWTSGLHPLSRVESLKEKDREILWRNSKIILEKAIRHGGSSVDDYRTATGETGEFQDFHNAYQRTGQKCKKNDGGTIKRIVVGQRSTHFCSVHQKISK